MRRHVAVLTVVLLVPVASKAEPAIANLWSARGLQAIERLKSLQSTESGGKGPVRRSKKQQYEMLLEFSFAVHAAKPEVAQKTEGTVFHVVLKSASGDLFDAKYLYERGATASSRPIAFGVDLLPKGWRVFVSATAPDIFLLAPEPGVLIAFPLGDPFEISVSADEPGSK